MVCCEIALLRLVMRISLTQNLVRLIESSVWLVCTSHLYAAARLLSRIPASKIDNIEIDAEIGGRAVLALLMQPRAISADVALAVF
ncbi:hypothetical protein HY29_18020 [Hyphomonas beringensis]|uniref:Uncharacterized protein n=1 Tax=Hyphomonas beringensis TaxID=1280946 RepID=A0A062U3P7_9PROT|nr:hypothetical protein HY29_18020 [Hyphomonas beringensis]